MADMKKQPEDKNKFKPGWNLTFVAENILTAAIAQYLALHDGELPSEDILHRMTKSSVEASVFFDKHKRKYGIHDRITDSIGEEEG